MHTRGLHGPSGHGTHRNPTGFGKENGYYPTGFGLKSHPGSYGKQGQQRYWSFRTSHKVFMITLSNDGGSVRICERTRLSGYETAMTLDAASWMLDILEELMAKEERQTVNYKKSFRNNSNSCFLENFHNNKGVFMKVSVLKNNKISMVIIPEEKHARGWKDFARCLKGVLKRDHQMKSDKANRTLEPVKEKPRGGIKQSWANIVKQSTGATRGHSDDRHFNSNCPKGSKPFGGRNIIPQQTPQTRKANRLGYWDFLPKGNGSFKPRNPFPRRRMEQKNFHEFLQAEDCDKDWSRAVIMFRNNSELSWSSIFYNLSREINRKLVVSQMFDDRSLIWCKNREEMEALIKMKSTIIPGTGATIVSFVKWSGEEQYKEVKVECRCSWIGVEGVPLNLWNLEIMGKIGDLCGGLLDVEKDTAEKNFLHHMRLKLRGDEQGFINNSILLRHGAVEFSLKLFKLNDWGYRFSGFFNTIWHQDSEFYKKQEAEKRQSLKEDELREEGSVAGAVTEVPRHEEPGILPPPATAGSSNGPVIRGSFELSRKVFSKKPSLCTDEGTFPEVDSRPSDVELSTMKSPNKELREYRESVPLQKVFLRIWKSLNVPRVGALSSPPGFSNLNLLWQPVEKDLNVNLGQDSMGRQLLIKEGQIAEIG
ncbi:hypothetical protein G4B88_007369 [Cannabis sativa]|uniref:DUF4283 domain-containing protein n=1 Tax=Cannabis sativa TaxID=3483 RepID=A0A7J6DNQ6_CANSA|nr:hypothetical protein G4B88_007369 [Cannabis sativa]